MPKSHMTASGVTPVPPPQITSIEELWMTSCNALKQYSLPFTEGYPLNEILELIQYDILLNLYTNRTRMVSPSYTLDSLTKKVSSEFRQTEYLLDIPYFKSSDGDNELKFQDFLEDGMSSLWNEMGANPALYVNGCPFFNSYLFSPVLNNSLFIKSKSEPALEPTFHCSAPLLFTLYYYTLKDSPLYHTQKTGMPFSPIFRYYDTLRNIHLDITAEYEHCDAEAAFSILNKVTKMTSYYETVNAYIEYFDPSNKAKSELTNAQKNFALFFSKIFFELPTPSLSIFFREKYFAKLSQVITQTNVSLDNIEATMSQDILNILSTARILLPLMEMIVNDLYINSDLCSDSDNELKAFISKITSNKMYGTHYQNYDFSALKEYPFEKSHTFNQSAQINFSMLLCDKPLQRTLFLYLNCNALKVANNLGDTDKIYELSYRLRQYLRYCYQTYILTEDDIEPMPYNHVFSAYEAAHHHRVKL